MKILIVEDDNFAARILVNLLKDNDINAQITIAHSLKETREFIAAANFDLIFLDVHLQDGLGIDIINELPVGQKIVFITGDPNYAVEAFEHNALDYLIKPVNRQRFEKTLKRIYEKDEEENTIVIRADYQFYKLKAEDILYIKSNGDYLSVVVENDRYTFYGRLKNFLDKLPKNSFRQCHRSYIVNISKASGMIRNNVLVNGSEIPVSGTYKKDIASLFTS
jgi:DNA-binding LytR/AlgR family response regulator